jgi:hypothetical protein
LFERSFNPITLYGVERLIELMKWNKNISAISFARPAALPLETTAASTTSAQGKSNVQASATGFAKPKALDMARRLLSKTTKASNSTETLSRSTLQYKYDIALDPLADITIMLQIIGAVTHNPTLEQVTLFQPELDAEQVHHFVCSNAC